MENNSFLIVDDFIQFLNYTKRKTLAMEKLLSFSGLGKFVFDKQTNILLNQMMSRPLKIKRISRHSCPFDLLMMFTEVSLRCGLATIRKNGASFYYESQENKIHDFNTMSSVGQYFFLLEAYLLHYDKHLNKIFIDLKKASQKIVNPKEFCLTSSMFKGLSYLVKHGSKTEHIVSKHKEDDFNTFALLSSNSLQFYEYFELLEIKKTGVDSNDVTIVKITELGILIFTKMIDDKIILDLSICSSAEKIVFLDRMPKHIDKDLVWFSIDKKLYKYYDKSFSKDAFDLMPNLKPAKEYKKGVYHFNVVSVSQSYIQEIIKISDNQTLEDLHTLILKTFKLQFFFDSDLSDSTDFNLFCFYKLYHHTSVFSRSYVSSTKYNNHWNCASNVIIGNLNLYENQIFHYVINNEKPYSDKNSISFDVIVKCII